MWLLPTSFSIRSRCELKVKWGFLALKLDTSKAYDRVEWGFVVAMQRRVGFGPKLVSVVLECISTPVFSVKAIRYLLIFFSCAEGLSALIRGQERLGLWNGFMCSLSAPIVTHLFFADDSLLFCCADATCYSSFCTILDTYEKGAGQLVNLEKSAFCCSRNISDDEAGRISRELGISHTSEMESYLGIPVRTGRQKLKIFCNITRRVQKQLLAWRARMFSAGGREILVKAVVQAIPTYTMSLYKLPSTLINNLQGLVARFWWGGLKDRRKIHWTRWEVLSR